MANKAKTVKTDNELLEKVDNSQFKSYLNKLEKRSGNKLLFEDALIKVLSNNIPKLKFVNPPSIKLDKKNKVLHREIIVSINDTHFGCIVKSEEVGGSNQFDWKIACRRMAFLAQQVIDYKIEKRKDVKKLHIVLNGDILQGVIHDLTARTAELLGLQQIGAMHILTHFISVIAPHFPEVIVHGVSGNHDDNLHRREGGRVTSHKYDSALMPVLASLPLAFKNIKHVKFNFTKSLYLDIQLPNGRLLATHGDTMFSKQLGNPSSSLNISGLSDAINRFNTGEIQRGKQPIKMVLLGHVHNHVNFTTFDGVKVYIAPSLSGIDTYAHSLGINTNQTGQVIFESTPKYILGDPRLVDLLEADNNSNLDKIIPTYDNQLILK